MAAAVANSLPYALPVLEMDRGCQQDPQHYHFSSIAGVRQLARAVNRCT